MQEEKKEQEQDFGIPDEPTFKMTEPVLKGWPSCEADSDSRVEANITRAPNQSENVKPTRSRKAQSKPKPKGDLTPLLNALAIEIQEAMDLMQIATGADRRTDLLCQKVSESLFLMEDIREKIAAAVGED